MISIVVSSVVDEVFQAFHRNVEETIGLPFEIIRIENKDGTMGICEAYNRGATQARFELLGFVHEDVIFHTQHWGAIVRNYFERDPSIGLIGVAGSKVKTRMVSNWWLPKIDGCEPKRGKVHQHFRDKPVQITEWWEGDGDLDEVVTADGVFLFTRKSVWQENPFDSKLLTRFHAYDFDFCMQVGQHWKVCVTRAVLVEHLSQGSFDLDWIKSTLAAHEKWKGHLPKSVHPNIPLQSFKFLDRQLLNDCYAKLARLGVHWRIGLPILFRAISLVHGKDSLSGLMWRCRITVSWIAGRLRKR